MRSTQNRDVVGSNPTLATNLNTMEFTIKFPIKQEDIPEESKKIREMIQARQAEIEILHTALETITKMCKHKHPSTGYNERDGSWATPCIYCGYSY
jgi:hypothetical protein